VRHQSPQPPRRLGSAEVRQRLGLDLADPLACDIEHLADLSRRARAITGYGRPVDLSYSDSPAPGTRGSRFRNQSGLGCTTLRRS
jgi:hypothetical protein